MWSVMTKLSEKMITVEVVFVVVISPEIYRSMMLESPPIARRWQLGHCTLPVEGVTKCNIPTRILAFVR